LFGDGTIQLGFRSLVSAVVFVVCSIGLPHSTAHPHRAARRTAWAARRRVDTMKMQNEIYQYTIIEKIQIKCTQ
jgi:hypothetical protein